MSRLVSYFKDFYNERRASGLFAEKDNSVFANIECSDEDAKRTILMYPYQRFADMNMMCYIKDTDEIEVNHLVWKDLQENEKNRLCAICDEKLELYYNRETLVT